MPLPSGLGLQFSKDFFRDYKGKLIIIKRNTLFYNLFSSHQFNFSSLNLHAKKTYSDIIKTSKGKVHKDL
jgi:hypothetical protein